MLVPALFSLLAVTTPQYAAPAEPEPAVQVWLDSESGYERGDRARVYVRTAQDGYLVVLHADAEGRVRVLFPLDPWLDDFVRGGQGVELRARGDRDAILIDERDGDGMVLAAWSPDPFRFDPFVRGDHWDYRAITPDGYVRDAEAELVDIAVRMAAGRSFQYDVAPYLVGARRYVDRGPVVHTNVHLSFDPWRPWCTICVDWHVGFRSGLHVSMSFGKRAWYDPWYAHPYYWDPVWYRPWWYHDPFWAPHHYRRVVFWQPFYYDPPFRYKRGIGVHLRYASTSCWRDPYCGRDPFPRPGRATGIALGDGYGWSSGRFDDTRSRGGIGIARGIDRGNAPLRITDPRSDLGRDTEAVRRVAARATAPIATSTRETRNERASRLTPLWPGDRGTRAEPDRSEPSRIRDAGAIERRAVAPATSTSEPTRTRVLSDIRGRAVTPPVSTEDPPATRSTRPTNTLRDLLQGRSANEDRQQSRATTRSTATRVVEPPSRSSTSITSRPGVRSTSEPPSRSSVSTRGTATRVVEPPSRSSTSITSRPGVRSTSEPPSRSSIRSRGTATRATEPPARSSITSRRTDTRATTRATPPPRSTGAVRSSTSGSARSSAGRASVSSSSRGSASSRASSGSARSSSGRASIKSRAGGG